MHGLGKWRHQPSPLLLSLFRTSQKVLCAPAETTNDVHAYTVKKIPRRPNIFGDDRGICATGVSKPGNQWSANTDSTRPFRARFALCLRCNHWVTNAKVSPFPPRSRCGIFFEIGAEGGPHPCKFRDTRARRNGTWGEWGSDAQIR